MALAIKHWLLKKMQDPRTTPLPRLVQGKGSLEQLATLCTELGMRKPLIVSDQMLQKIGLVQKVTDGLAEKGLAFAVYDKVSTGARTNTHIFSWHRDRRSLLSCSVILLLPPECIIIIILRIGFVEQAESAAGLDSMRRQLTKGNKGIDAICS